VKPREPSVPGVFCCNPGAKPLSLSDL